MNNVSTKELTRNIPSGEKNTEINTSEITNVRN